MKRILIVDDVESWRNLTRVILTEAGYDVIEAASGERALEVARSAPPDLVLLDLNLPRLNGFETAERLRALAGCGAVPIILLTTADLDGGCDRAPAPCVDGYINKRDAPDVLVSCVQAYFT